MSHYDPSYAATDAYFGDPDPILLEHLDALPEGGRVLDIGVGQGRHALELAARGFRVTGIDPSAEAIGQCRAAAAERGLELELIHGDVFEYAPEARFDAILCFGLMQILPRGDNASLVHRFYEWTGDGSVVFLTAWHVDDPSYDRIADTWERVGLHSFRSPDGEYRTYLARGVMKTLFRAWKTLHRRETLGPPHRHGEGGEEHRHGVIELVAQRRLDD